MSAYSPIFASLSPGASAPVKYLQSFTASSLWTVNHNLGREPSVTVLTVGGLEMLADVQHTSLNQFTVSFSQPQSGRIIAF